MKYLGEKSLSSILYGFLYVSWYLLILVALFIGVILSIAMFADPVMEPAVSAFDKMKYELFNEIHKDQEAWNFFTGAPVFFRVMALIFLSGATLLMLTIIKKGQRVFYNFKNNIVFNEANVLVISKVSKLLIIFSILTVNFTSLLVSIILLILTDVFKNGTALQEEHDLTV